MSVTTYQDPRTEALTGVEPGVRMLAGKPYIFDGGALGDHYARVAIERAPDNLWTLSDADLKALEVYASRGLRLDVALAAEALHERCWVELTRRGFRSDGTRVAPVSMKAAA
jgi:hypothetical protein